MRKIKPHEATKWLHKLRQAIPTGADKITAETAEIWSKRLAEIPAEGLAGAALVLYERCKFFPSLAEILEVCREVMGENDVPNMGDAYAEVREAFRDVGFYGDPGWSHIAIKKAVHAVGGWKYLCSSENQVADRARFYEVYGKYEEEAYKEKTTPELTKQIAKRCLEEVYERAEKLRGGGDHEKQ